MNNGHNDDNIFDPQGFRYNVGIILLNDDRKVFWGKRCGQEAWQFPQGGVNAGESSESAMLRELYEETGLLPQQVSIMGVTENWLAYRLPPRYRRNKKPGITQCIGQKQKWFLLRLIDPEAEFDFDAAGSPEFDSWQWIEYWKPAESVVQFKRNVYWSALEELSSLIPEMSLEKPKRKYPNTRRYPRRKAPSFAKRRNRS